MADYTGKSMNPDRCKASVRDGNAFYFTRQCERKRVQDGYCKQHHPDAVKKRVQERDARDEKRTRRAFAASDRAAQIERLEERVGELSATMNTYRKALLIALPELDRPITREAHKVVLKALSSVLADHLAPADNS